LAGRSTDVKMELRSLVFGLYRSLLISCGNGQWRIPGTPDVFRPEPVVEAWRQNGIKQTTNDVKEHGHDR